MRAPRVYADFQNLDNSDRLRLTCAGTLADLNSQGIELREGLVLTVYTDDADDEGNPDDLETEGVVQFNAEENCWVAAIDWTVIWHASDYLVQHAVRELRAVGLDVEERAYGFHLSHQDSAGIYDGHCGSEHDWSISLAIFVNEPPNHWFFRYSVREMAQFIASSYAKMRQGEFESLLAAMQDANRKYDYEDLKRRLEQKAQDVRRRYAEWNEC